VEQDLEHGAYARIALEEVGEVKVWEKAMMWLDVTRQMRLLS